MILAIVIFMNVRGCVFTENSPIVEQTFAGDPAADQPPADFQFTLQARYLVGARAVARALNQDTSQFAIAADDLHRVVLGAGSPADQLRWAAVAGELQGSQEALDDLHVWMEGHPSHAVLQEDARTLLAVYRDGPNSLPLEQRSALLQRHGWFAKLALAHGLEPGTPLRRDAIAPAQRVTVVLLLAIVGVVSLTGIGFLLLILAIVLLVLGKIQFRYPDVSRLSSPGRGAFLEAFTLYLGSYLGISIAAVFIPWLLPLALLTPLAALWPLCRGVSWQQLRLGLGWTRGRGVVREVLAGAVGYVSGLPLIAVAVLLTLLLTLFAQPGEGVHPIVELAQDASILNIIILYGLACVWAPLVEEMFFRGAFYHHMRQRTGFVVSALVVGVIFASIHPQGWVGLPALTAIAFVLASIREWRGSLVASVTAHALNNGAAVTLLLLLLA
ncbi:MAG: CPBP family intramembrane glutamic endopeptidase [Phycisphaeraceae bacterium]